MFSGESDSISVRAFLLEIQDFLEEFHVPEYTMEHFQLIKSRLKGRARREFVDAEVPLHGIIGWLKEQYLPSARLAYS